MRQDSHVPIFFTFSHYDQGFSELCEIDKNVVQRLKILAGLSVMMIDL